jgi:hypothetical protein
VRSHLISLHGTHGRTEARNHEKHRTFRGFVFPRVPFDRIISKTCCKGRMFKTAGSATFRFVIPRAHLLDAVRPRRSPRIHEKASTEALVF